MQPESIVNTVLMVFVGLMIAALVVGRLIGERLRDPKKAMLTVILTAIGLDVLLLVAVQPTAQKIGPIVTRQTVIFCVALAAGLIGGCATGLARRRGDKKTLKAFAVLTTVTIGMAMLAFFSRVNEVMALVRDVGLLQSGQKYEPDKNQDCPANLKSLYTAMQQYVQDWDALPPAANWMDNEDLVSKVSRNEWLHCPAVSDRHDSNYGYAYNDAVAGRKAHGKPLADMPNAARTPLIYDSSTLGKSAHDALTSLPKPGRHEGRDNILYLDGHVEAVAP